MRSCRCDIMGFGSYLNSRPVQGVGDWSDFWTGLGEGVSKTDIGDAAGAAGGIGTALGSLINVAAPSLLNEYVYGNKPAGSTTPVVKAPNTTGYVTGPNGQLVPVPGGAGSAALAGMSMPLIIGGIALIVLVALKK